MSSENSEILKLWHDKNWIGSYRGIRTFQSLLKTDKNIDVSEKDLYNLLKNDKLYLIHLKPKSKINRRKYDINCYGEIVQCDLGFMFIFNDYNCFLLLIDCFSFKIFVEPLKSKSSEIVLKAFVKLLEKYKTTIYKVEVDQGTEFVKCKKYCEENHIIFKYKYGQNKASFAEWAILNIKRRLYKLLRDNLTQDWPRFIKNVCEDHNNLPQKHLGFLKPNDINSPYDSAKVIDAKKHHNIEIFREPTYIKQNENVELYNSNSKNLQVNDYVYLDFKKSLFSKSFDSQVRKIWYSILFSNEFSFLKYTAF